MTDRTQQLMDVANPHEKAELATMHNAVIQCMQAYKKASTATNKRDWDAARNGLAAVIERLWPVHFPAEAAADPEVFEQQKAAREYLLEKGYKVSAGKFSTDYNNGRLRVQRDGTVLLVDLLKYASTLDIDRKKISSFEQLERRKAELEVEKLEQQIKKGGLENRKEDRKWVLKEDSEIESATLIGLLMDNLSHRLHLDQGKLLHAAGGNPARAAEFAEAVENTVAAAFNEIAEGKRFDVAIEEDE